MIFLERKINGNCIKINENNDVINAMQIETMTDKGIGRWANQKNAIPSSNQYGFQYWVISYDTTKWNQAAELRRHFGFYLPKGAFQRE